MTQLSQEVGCELLLGNLARAVGGGLYLLSPSVLLCLSPAFLIFVFTPSSSDSSHSFIFLWIALRAGKENGCHNNSAYCAYGEPGREDESGGEAWRQLGMKKSSESVTLCSRYARRKNNALPEKTEVTRARHRWSLQDDDASWYRFWSRSLVYQFELSVQKETEWLHEVSGRICSSGFREHQLWVLSSTCWREIFLLQRGPRPWERSPEEARPTLSVPLCASG